LFSLIAFILLNVSFFVLNTGKKMILLGRNLSPFVRRTATVMNILNIKYEQRMLSTADDQLEIKASNPIGRVPSLILPDGEALIDSNAIIDYVIGEFDLDRQLLASSGSERRMVLQTTMLAHGVMEKGVAISYEQNRRPKEKIYPEWLSYLEEQLSNGIASLESIALNSSNWLHGDKITLADITTVCAIDYLGVRMPSLVQDKSVEALLALSKKANAIDAIGNSKPSN
jgi:glutathione S-transferase